MGITPSKGRVFKIHDVPDRTDILFHVANWSRELLGCVAPGVGVDLRQDMVTASRLALDEMLEELPDEWTLEVVYAE